MPFANRGKASNAFVRFCAEFIRVPKGHGVGEPFVVRGWQRGLVASVLDGCPRVAGWMLGRGNGKTTLLAALAIYTLMTGGEGASIICVAYNEAQARLCFDTAARMVELCPELSSRVHIHKDRMVVPCRGASFVCLPASPSALEGLDYTLAIADEVGRISREVWEVIVLAQAKRPVSTCIGIGTPGPESSSVLTDLRNYALAHPEDESHAWREFSAAGFESHPVDCLHCFQLANPAHGDFLALDASSSFLPPRVREPIYRRSRLCQLVVENEHPFLPRGLWETLATGTGVPNGERVVLALDGSHSGDATAVVVGTVGIEPHFDVVHLQERPDNAEGWRVDVLAAEDAIREACKRWDVVEIVADPFRWQRTLQVLEGERLPVLEFPQSVPRQTAATSDLYAAVVSGKLSHSGNPDLTRHVASTVTVEDNRGIRLGKVSRRAGNIDLAAALMMAHSRCVWRATRTPKRRRAVSFAS